jgi:urea carboxylase system permease
MTDTPTTAPRTQDEHDAHHLASLGYRQELQRTLGLFSNFAVAFSYISVSTGTFALFALGIATGGPAFFWSWPIVAAGQFLIALNFAELSSHYPVAGSIYQWSKRIAGPGTGWMIGWFYLGATLLTVTSVAFTLPFTLVPLFQNNFGWVLDTGTEVRIALITLIVTTALNIAGVRLLALINNIGVVAEILGMFVFALILLVASHHQSLGVFFQTAGTEHTPGAGAGYTGVFLAAMFMSLFVIYGFDTAGSLGEETKNPGREAPRGVLLSIGLSFLAGLLFLGAAILAIPNVGKIMADPNPLPDIITGAFGSSWGKIYLAVVSIAIFVCTLAIQAAAVRLVFSMSRDRRLPLSNLWSTVHPAVGTPIYAVMATGVLAAIPLLVSQQIAVLAIGATGLIYLSYFMTNLVLLRARRNGWPERSAWFTLGRWAIPVNIAALAYGGAMLINFAWPRPASNPVFSSLAAWSAKWPILGGAPIFETYIVLLAVVGGLYWYLVERDRLEPTHTPRPDDSRQPVLAGSTADGA